MCLRVDLFWSFSPQTKPMDFAHFESGLRVFLQPSLPQALFRSEDLSFWTRATVHVSWNSLLQGMSSAKEASLLF